MFMSAVLNALYTLWNQIVYAVSNIRVFDVIDIIVVAILIYKAIKFLRETRAGQLVKGIAVLLVAYILAKWWDLTVLKWLLSVVVDSAILVVAIIFQPELRRILERVGQTGLIRTQTLDDDFATLYNCIDEIGKAARVMQDEKIGALIVFERKTQLGEIINTGTVIDAVASASMVNNVFFPKSPLHDGALIVRDGKLYAAGCILPLTQSNAFSSELGTRHRAAIGMTENSDAVVLVVSEETGNISIVENGQITRGYNGASATAQLRSLLIDEELENKDNRVVAALKNVISFSKKKNNDGEDVENENTGIN